MLDGRFNTSVKIWCTIFLSGRFFRGLFYRDPFFRGRYFLNEIFNLDYTLGLKFAVGILLAYIQGDPQKKPL